MRGHLGSELKTPGCMLENSETLWTVQNLSPLFSTAETFYIEQKEENREE